MGKIYRAIGLMSGTSLDGIDLSIIESDGNREYLSILDRYFKYDNRLFQKILKLRNKLLSSENLNFFSNELKSLEKEITLFSAKVVNETLKSTSINIDLIGFHGQTIFHDSNEKISKQLGDGKLLSQLTKKNVIYNFRQNDLENGGQGAPLTPIFHNVLANQLNKNYKLKFPINFLNIGGIANITLTANWDELWDKTKIYAYDIGPGNCLIDEWIRKNSNKKYDEDGLLARSGKTDTLILNQALENFQINSNYEKSLDIKDFDIFFAKGLSLENGAATITDFTAKLISDGMIFSQRKSKLSKCEWIFCGGGRKNKFLLEKIKKNLETTNIQIIDQYNIDGDFIESQAFAFLAIRSFKKMPISFPSTTRCKNSITGGILVKNF
tara:strand:- start:60 stop:1205 length:1146 start_codon:yes stop_codon:yes gene_type:complete